jgi:hypothetical protein
VLGIKRYSLTIPFSLMIDMATKAGSSCLTDCQSLVDS